MQAAGLSILRGWAAVGVRPIAPTVTSIQHVQRASSPTPTLLVSGGIGLLAATEARRREWQRCCSNGLLALGCTMRTRATAAAAVVMGR